MDGPRTTLCKCFVYWNSWTNITHSCLLVTTRWPLGKHWVTTPLWEVTDTSIKSSSFTNQNQIKPLADKNLGLVTRRGPEGRGLALILLLVTDWLTDWLTDIKGPQPPPDDWQPSMSRVADNGRMVRTLWTQCGIMMPGLNTPEKLNLTR